MLVIVASYFDNQCELTSPFSTGPSPKPSGKLLPVEAANMAEDDFHSSPTAPSKANVSSKILSSGRDSQLEDLHARQASLESTVAELLSQRTSLVNSISPTSDPQESEDTEARAKLAVDAANIKIKSQIKQLQQYNDIKDVGTQLMGIIAEKRGCRIGEVQEEFGINPDD
jgi:hypothetical protein